VCYLFQITILWCEVQSEGHVKFKEVELWISDKNYPLFIDICLRKNISSLLSNDKLTYIFLGVYFVHVVVSFNITRRNVVNNAKVHLWFQVSFTFVIFPTLVRYCIFLLNDVHFLWQMSSVFFSAKGSIHPKFIASFLPPGNSWSLLHSICQM
jgi:hypothetical protein